MKLQRSLVVDSSSLLAFERAELIDKLKQVETEFWVPRSVKKEVGESLLKDIVKVKELRGRSQKKVNELTKKTGLDKGEAECLVLANREDMEFIISDDRRLLRQRTFSDDRYLKEIKVAGFSFLLFLMEKQDVIKEADVWEIFEKIIDANNWSRSEVYVANYTFLREMDY